MKKLKLLIILVLGIILGGLFFQVKTQRNQIHQPLIREGKIDINSLINSISSTINATDLGLIDNKYERFETVYNILQTSYYDTDKLNSGTMIQKAIKAFVDAIDDPYTVYMDSDQNSGFHEELKGEADFEGIGAIVSKKDYYVLIEEILKGSPAYLAGLMTLDRIIMVNTGYTKDLDINQAVALIRGPKGTKVRLTIERTKKDGTKEILEKEVTRDKLSVPSVTSKILTGTCNLKPATCNSKIGYINISIIGEETENLLQKEINNLKDQDIQGIILDLRGNGGGLLPIAVEICSHFVPKGKLIVTARYKTYDEEIYKSKGYNSFIGLPIAVLVDGLTASAGEIISLALQQNIGAQIIGTQTFGKGSIQTMDEFTDHASLKYTIGKRYAPDDTNIDQIGITPDIDIPFDTTGYQNDRIDNQLQKAIETIQVKK